MKKSLSLILLLFGIFFIGNLNVYANNCDNYACTTCEYAVSGGNIIYKVVGDGNGSVTIATSFDAQKNVNVTNNVPAANFMDFNNVQCPKVLHYSKLENNNISVYLYKNDFATLEAKLVNENNNNLTLYGAGNNIVQIDGGTGFGADPNIKVTISPKEGCQAVLTSELVEWLQWVLDVIRIGGLVLTVILGVVDYVNATFSSKDDSIAKANKNFTTRLMSLALLFLVPTLIEFVLKLFSISSTGADPRCGLN